MDEGMLHEAGTTPGREVVMRDAKFQTVIKWCWSRRVGVDDGDRDPLGSSWGLCSAKLPLELHRAVGAPRGPSGLSHMNF